MRLTRCESITPRIYYRSSASSTGAASIRHLSLPRSKPVPRKSRTRLLRFPLRVGFKLPVSCPSETDIIVSPLKDRQTRKTHSQHRAAVVHRWMATVHIRELLLPVVTHPVPLRTTRRDSNQDPVSSHRPVHLDSNLQHSRIYNDRRRSKAEPNLLIQVSAVLYIFPTFADRFSMIIVQYSFLLLLLVLRRT